MKHPLASLRNRRALAPPLLAMAVVGAVLAARMLDGDPDADAAARAACSDPEVALLVPVTGDAASIGAEQRNWARFALERHNRDNEPDVRFLEGDTQLEAAQAATLATRFVANQDVLAVVGPAGSPEVLAAGPIFTQAEMPFVGMSATRVSLTDGSLTTFFRVVPNDAVQAPTIAAYIENTLQSERVFIVDDQTSYGVPLADAVAKELTDAGIEVERESVTRSQSDFSAFIGRIQDGDLVFLPWQLAAKAQIFGQQLREQGRRAVIFGSDGLFAPEDFTVDGSYVAAFAPDVRGLPSAADLVRAYDREHGDFGTFGPPTFVAAQVVLRAVARACEDGQATRPEVARLIGETRFHSRLLGREIAFNAAGDLRDARFFLFRIRDGRYETIAD